MSPAYIGKTIRQMREWRGLTVEALAAKASKTVEEIKSIESGKKALTLEELFELAEILQCHLEIRMVPDSKE